MVESLQLIVIFQLVLIIVIMCYFYFQLHVKIESINKNIKMESKATNQKISALGQFLTSYLKH